MIKSVFVVLWLGFFSLSASAQGLGLFSTQFDTYLVFSIPETVQIVPGTPTSFDGTEFLQDVVGLDDVAAEAEQAKNFLNSRFGIDIDRLVAEGRGFFAIFEINSAIGNSVRVLNDTFVPARGLPLRSGGFAFTATDPGGITLGGDVAGMVLQPGGIVAQGYWSFKPLKQETVVLKWTMKTPLMRNLSQFPLFYTDVSTLDGSQIGTGAGIDGTQINDNGTFTPLFRHVVQLQNVLR